MSGSMAHNILNNEDIFFMYTKNDISFLFKGINPFHNRVFGLDIQLDRVFCNKICDKKEVTELRKATKKEEELYYKCYPKIDFSILNNTDWFFAVDFLGKTYVFNQNIGYYCITTGEFEGGLQLFQYSIKILRKATEADLVPFYERYPELELVKKGDLALLFNNFEYIEADNFIIAPILNIYFEDFYPYYSLWYNNKYAMKIKKEWSISEIKKRFQFYSKCMDF